MQHYIKYDNTCSRATYRVQLYFQIIQEPIEMYSGLGGARQLRITNKLNKYYTGWVL